MVPREALDILETRALVWQTVFALLKLGHKERLPGRPFGPDLPLFLVYGTALLSVYSRRPVRASSISRQLEIPRETVRRQHSKRACHCKQTEHWPLRASGEPPQLLLLQ
jgi:hypothetical protein